MFTGIITDIGELVNIEVLPQVTKFTIKTVYNSENIVLGASIACNGCCLTVIKKMPHAVVFDLSPETIEKTIFKNAKIGDKINLEQALKIGDELGGHIVTGHVDCLVEVVDIIKNLDNWVVNITVPEKYKKFVAQKGSVTLNGVSLTVNDVADRIFTINIIPHTLQNTNLNNINIGSLLNFEIDILARYIERQTSCIEN